MKDFDAIHMENRSRYEKTDYIYDDYTGDAFCIDGLKINRAFATVSASDEDIAEKLGLNDTYSFPTNCDPRESFIRILAKKGFRAEKVDTNKTEASVLVEGTEVIYIVDFC